MKIILFALLLTTTSLMAELTQAFATAEFTKKKIKIIDIRTLTEWKETGIIKGSYTITFFDEKGKFFVPDFLNKLDKVVKKNEKFALICRVGSRTVMVAEFLSNKFGYKVINLKGGIIKMIDKGYKTVPFKK